MTTSFPRSTRAIHADSLAPGLAILITLLVLLLAWMGWLVLFQIPFYQTSLSAQVTPEALIVADFSPDVLPQIQFGQEALFVPDTDTGSPPLRPLQATVVEIDPTGGQVWFVMTADPTLQRQLYPGLSGQARVVIRKRSPLTLLLEAAGMRPSA